MLSGIVNIYCTVSVPRADFRVLKKRFVAMPTWMPISTLPNIEVREPIEAGYFALVDIHDERVRDLCDGKPGFTKFVTGFSNEFGVSIRPTLLISHRDAPKMFLTADAVAALRDTVSLCTIPSGWAKAIRFGNSSGIKYSDYFDLYPWSLSDDDQHLSTMTLDLMGFHVIDQLRPQCTPAISLGSMTHSTLDEPLMSAVLSRFAVCFETEDPDPTDVRIFRSLNMANAAARLPAGIELTNYDMGRAISLWSSAIEILAPAKGEAFRQVYALLDKIEWRYTPCKEAKYEAYGYKNDKTLRNLPCWLFGAINHARNDFLHGNPITRSRLVVPPAKQPLNNYAPLLYRMALAAYLELKYTPREPRQGESEYETYLSDSYLFRHFQGDFEVALSKIMLTKEEQQARRFDDP